MLVIFNCIEVGDEGWQFDKKATDGYYNQLHIMKNIGIKVIDCVSTSDDEIFDIVNSNNLNGIKTVVIIVGHSEIKNYIFYNDVTMDNNLGNNIHSKVMHGKLFAKTNIIPVYLICNSISITKSLGNDRDNNKLAKEPSINMVNEHVCAMTKASGNKSMYVVLGEIDLNKVTNILYHISHNTPINTEIYIDNMFNHFGVSHYKDGEIVINIYSKPQDEDTILGILNTNRCRKNKMIYNNSYMEITLKVKGHIILSKGSLISINANASAIGAGIGVEYENNTSILDKTETILIVKIKQDCGYNLYNVYNNNEYKNVTIEVTDQNGVLVSTYPIRSEYPINI